MAQIPIVPRTRREAIWRYNRRYWYSGKDMMAHRVAHILFVGEWPADKESDHRCENAICVRPHEEHSWPGTHKENMGRTRCEYCGRGHLLTLDTVYFYKNSRECMECAKLRAHSNGA
jgi:hypothetical protein